MNMSVMHSSTRSPHVHSYLLVPSHRLSITSRAAKDDQEGLHYRRLYHNATSSFYSRHRSDQAKSKPNRIRMLSSRSIHKFSNLAATAARFKFFSTALRSYPQYTVYGDNCMLSMRIMLPTLKCSRNNAIYVDGSKGVGRILLEWTPRASDGTL